MHTREMTESDIEEVLVIRSLAMTDSANTITETMILKAMRGACKGFVAIVDDSVVGFSLANRRNKELWGIFVLPNYQRRGIGRALLLAATGWLFNCRRGFFFRPIQNIHLTCTPDSPAQHFYSAMGWRMGRIKSGVRHMHLSRHK